MCEVQAFEKHDAIKTCLDLAREFSCEILRKYKIYDEIHVVFDRYDVPISLKQSTRERRQGGVDPVCYRITDGTVISKISVKTFLSHTETKQQITEYFGKHLLQLGKGKGIDLVVSFKDGYHSTIRNVSSLASTQEEADTKMLLHAAHASKLGATGVDIFATDTDVLVLTIRQFPELC